MRLTNLKVGEKATIVSMEKLEPAMRKKLLNLGFLPKAKIELLHFAPLGDPVAVRCANTSIALRKSLTNQISVEVTL